MKGFFRVHNAIARTDDESHGLLYLLLRWGFFTVDYITVQHNSPSISQAISHHCHRNIFYQHVLVGNIEPPIQHSNVGS